MKTFQNMLIQKQFYHMGKAHFFCSLNRAGFKLTRLSPALEKPGPPGKLCILNLQPIGIGEWRKHLHYPIKSWKRVNRIRKKGYFPQANAVEISGGDRMLVQNCRPATRNMSIVWKPDVYVFVKKRGELPFRRLRK